MPRLEPGAMPLCPDCGAQPRSPANHEGHIEWECGSDNWRSEPTRSVTCTLRVAEATIARLEAEAEALRTERYSLQHVVDQLATFADGSPVLPGMAAYHPSGRWGIVLGLVGDAPIMVQGGGKNQELVLIGTCWPTRKAAEAAGGNS